MKLNKYWIVGTGVFLGIMTFAKSEPHPVTQMDLISLLAVIFLMVGTAIEKDK